MTWVDLAAGFILISACSPARGLVRKCWAAAPGVECPAAFFALPATRGLVRGWLPSPEWIDPVSFIIVFLIALIVLILIARSIGRVVRRSALGGVDRTLGLVLGIERGTAVVIIAYIIGQIVFPIERQLTPSSIKEH
jgi:membrane protein required for colicin V production